MDQEKIGILFKERREAKNITQQELADILNVTDRAISNWEHGRRLPDYSLLAKLCDILSISLEEVFLMGKKKEDKKQSIKEINEMIDYYFQNHTINEVDGLSNDDTFEELVVGDCNSDAFCRLYEIANNIERINPLYIYGPYGSGKTTLVQWFGNSCKNLHRKKVLFINGKKFNDDCYNLSIGQKTIDSFVKQYKKAEVIIIDDMQNIVGNKSTIELYHMLDYILDNHIQLVMTGDKPSGYLRQDDQIKERIGRCYHIPLEEVDIFTRKRILHNLVKSLPSLKIDNQVINYIAIKSQNINANILKEAISNIIGYALIENKKTINLQEAKLLLSDLFDNDIEAYTKEITGNYRYYMDTNQNLLIRLNKKTKKYKIFTLSVYDDKVHEEWFTPKEYDPEEYDKVSNYDFKKLKKVIYQEDVDDYIEFYIDDVKRALVNEKEED